MNLKSNPLSEKQLKALNDLVDGITSDQIIWLNGFLEGKLTGLNGKAPIVQVLENEPSPEIKLTIIYGSETGRSQSLAEMLAEKAAFKNISANVLSMYDYDYKNLKEEENLAIIVSTHGKLEKSRAVLRMAKAIPQTWRRIFINLLRENVPRRCQN